MSRRLWAVGTIAGAVLSVIVPSRLPAQERDAFYLVVRSDTFSVERFARSATRLESELLIKSMGARVNLVATLDPQGDVDSLRTEFRQASADPTGPPTRAALLVFRGDSVVVTGAGREQRIKTQAGAVPYLNPSFAIVELMVDRARRAGKDTVSVPIFAVQGGQTVVARVIRLGADSVIVDFGNAQVRLAVGSNGTITGGEIPAQGLRLLRVDRVSAGALAVAKPDYSAPPDAPYTATDVTVPTTMGFTLAGTLTMPKDAHGRVPAIVTITGSGQEDRDEAIPIVKGYRPFRQIADTLARHGIAVLRMDDRGFGASGGNAATATSADFADDIRAGLAYLRTRPDIDSTRLGLIGHSEGGLIAPLVAATNPALRAVVLLAGPAQTGRTIIAYQQRYAIDHLPLSPAQRDSAQRSSATTIDSLAATNPWMRFFLDYDPLATARKVRVPTLILQGATDRQVTPEQAEVLGKAMRGGGNRDVTVRIFPETDHLFVRDPDGNPARYASLPSAAIRSDVLAAIVDWLSTRMR